MVPRGGEPCDNRFRGIRAGHVSDFVFRVLRRRARGHDRHTRGAGESQVAARPHAQRGHNVRVTHSAVAAVLMIGLTTSAYAQSAGDPPPEAPARQPRHQRRHRLKRTIPISTSTSRSPISRSAACRRRCGSPGTRARSASRTASRGRSGAAISAISLSDLFGLDNGALIGLEYRFGLFRGHADRRAPHVRQDHQFFAQRELVGAERDFPLRHRHPRGGRGHQQLPRQIFPHSVCCFRARSASRAAFYLEPIWVGNTNALPEELIDDNSTFMIGLGTRVRITSDDYLVFEACAAHRRIRSDGAAHISFALEKRAGGHMFQLNFSNHFGTTLAQIARGGADQRRLVSWDSIFRGSSSNSARIDARLGMSCIRREVLSGRR